MRTLWEVAACCISLLFGLRVIVTLPFVQQYGDAAIRHSLDVTSLADPFTVLCDLALLAASSMSALGVAIGES